MSRFLQMIGRRIRVVVGVAVLAAIGLHPVARTTAAGGAAAEPPRTGGFKYEQEAATDDFLRAVVGCERRQLACPGASEAVVFTSRADNTLRVFVQRTPDARMRRPRLSNGRNERIRLLSVLEVQQRVASDSMARALQYVVHFPSASSGKVSVVYQSLFHFGALTVSAGACGQSEYAIHKDRNRWVCGEARPKPAPAPRPHSRSHSHRARR